MNRCGFLSAVFCAAICSFALSQSVQADLDIQWDHDAEFGPWTRWTVRGGEISLAVAEESAASRGLHLTIETEAGDESVWRRVPIEAESDFQMTELREEVGLEFRGAIRVSRELAFETRSGRKSLSSFVLRIAEVAGDGAAALELAESAEGPALLRADAIKIGMDRWDQELMIEAGTLVATGELASILGRADIEGLVLGTVELTAQLWWSGGMEPIEIDYEAKVEESFGGDPRAATICPGQPGASVGADVIVGELYDVASYGSETVSGVSIAAFAVGTISCNVGSVPLEWFTSGNGGTDNRHPTIGQNLFRLKTLADGSSRFDQIGQAWLKHGFTALQHQDCCTNCTATSGTRLGVGCSDPYSASLNGGQGSAGPKYQVNGFTGVQVHPVANPSFSGTVARRLQVEVAQLDPALNGGGFYFVEGQYQAKDDAAAGNQRNNASYRRVNMTGSGSSWMMSLHESGTQRMEAGIRAWKDYVPDVVETDVPVPSEGLVILAARVTETNGGVWHYEYAVQNVCSDRSIGLFSVPIDPEARVLNIGFNDVAYRNGEPYDGTDWAGSFAGGQVSWSTTAHGVNPNANAIRWGTMYTFRFDANAAPTTGNANLGLFKPGTPASVSASTLVPGTLAPISVVVDGPLPALLSPCVPNSFDVEVWSGGQTVVAGSEKLFYRLDGGAYVEAPLTQLAGEAYQAKVPGANCGDAPQYYVQAQGSGGGIVRSPANAPSSVYSYQVGVPQTGVVLDVDFNGGMPAGWSATGLWNVTNLCPVMPLCGTGLHAYYGQTLDCNYENGVGNNGRLTSPPFALPSTGTIQLTYCSNLQTENFPPYDHADVQVNGSPVDTVTDSAAWETRTVDLTLYAGQTVALEFVFNTIDNISNEFRGWQIDDVLITGDQVVCEGSYSMIKGDMTGNGEVDAGDLQDFVDASLALSTAPADVCPGDFDEDGMVAPGDVPGMVDALLGP